MASLSPPSDLELEPGCLFAGKYRLERPVGRGAMGTVWSALHESLGQRVAIKVISPEHASSEELRRRFDTEARAAAKLRSRFVVGVFDHGTTKSELPYIVMEFLDGEPLEDRIARLGVLPLHEVSRITHHVGRALSRAHASGIIHRDLKPANIFITQTEDEDGGWIAKVLDFGIAKVDDFAERSTTKTGAVLGTPLFMSPEQVRGASSVDPRADLYSLGMVVYNMLTGTYAFVGQSFGDLLVSICTDPLPQLSARARNIPPALDLWFQKACARDLSDRFQTAEELLDAFSLALGEPAPKSTTTHSEATTRAFGTISHHAATYADTKRENPIARADTISASTHEGLQSSGPSTRTLHEEPLSIPRAERSLLLPTVVSLCALIGGVWFWAMRSDTPPSTASPLAVEGLPSSAPREPAPPSPEEIPSREASPDPSEISPQKTPPEPALEPSSKAPLTTSRPTATPSPTQAPETSPPTSSAPTATTTKPSSPTSTSKPTPPTKKPATTIPDVGF